MTRILTLVAAIVLALASVGSASAGHRMAVRGGSLGSHLSLPNGTVVAALHPVGGSGVRGAVLLRQLPNNSGTAIQLAAVGLTPGHMYRSLYYGNSSCQIEPYSASDVIGGDYMASAFGIGVTSGMADDNLDDIHSVSVRDASMPFNPASPGTLLACAVVHSSG